MDQSFSEQCLIDRLEQSQRCKIFRNVYSEPSRVATVAFILELIGATQLLVVTLLRHTNHALVASAYATLCLGSLLHACSLYYSRPSVCVWVLRTVSLLGLSVSTGLADKHVSALSFGFAVCLGFSAVSTQILYRSFAGLFGPLWPSERSPTILPTFGLATLSAVLLGISYGLSLSENLPVHRVARDVQIASFSLWVFSAYASLSISVLATRV